MKKTLENTWDEWKPWIDICVNKSVEEVVRSTPKKNKAKYFVALALSVAKWHPANPSRGLWECGLCEYYKNICDRCILSEKGYFCNQIDSIWRNAWFESAQRIKQTYYSDKLFWILMEIYREAVEGE